MPILPLFQPSQAEPDAWHQVTAPGGYEWWYFDAEDPATDTQLVAIFLEGFIFHPGYLRQYFRFRRSPTTVTPPQPRDFTCAYFVLYRNGRIARQFMTQYPSDQFAASSTQTDVRIGPNTLVRESDGALKLCMSGTPWSVTWQGPKREANAALTAELSFKPRLPYQPQERHFLSQALAGADHRWIIADPLCDVTATINTGGASAKSINFTGRGYHDHNYGTGPIGPGLKRWIWGRVLLEDRVVTFHFARAIDKSLPDEVHVIEADAAGRRELAIKRVIADWSKRTALRLSYPQAIEFGNELRLRSPKVIDSAPFYMRLTYDATFRGKRATAFCEVAYPHRLRWPILGRMIEMSIERAR